MNKSWRWFKDCFGKTKQKSTTLNDSYVQLVLKRSEFVKCLHSALDFSLLKAGSARQLHFILRDLEAAQKWYLNIEMHFCRIICPRLARLRKISKYSRYSSILSIQSRWTCMYHFHLFYSFKILFRNRFLSDIYLTGIFCSSSFVDVALAWQLTISVIICNLY